MQKKKKKKKDLQDCGHVVHKFLTVIKRILRKKGISSGAAQISQCVLRLSTQFHQGKWVFCDVVVVSAFIYLMADFLLFLRRDKILFISLMGAN